jgi:hypothetical protein
MRIVASACPAGSGERIVRGILSLVLGGFAVAAVETSPWLAVAIGLAAAVPAFGAVTGRCPTDFLQHRRPPAPNALGVPEARQPIHLGSKEDRHAGE